MCIVASLSWCVFKSIILSAYWMIWSKEETSTLGSPKSSRTLGTGACALDANNRRSKSSGTMNWESQCCNNWTATHVAVSASERRTTPAPPICWLERDTQLDASWWISSALFQIKLDLYIFLIDWRCEILYAEKYYGVLFWMQYCYILRNTIYWHVYIGHANFRDTTCVCMQ